MGFYERQVLPRVIDVLLGKGVDPLRARVASGVSGEVLEVGFGSGRNVPHLPDGVTRLVAVDPATVGRKLAAKRIAARGIPVEFVGLDGQSLPLDDASVDHVLVTWTLCTIPDVDAALVEMHRVLRPGGRLHFVEHGRSPDPESAAKQERLTPKWRKVAGGCHLNRQIPELVRRAGFVEAHLESYCDRGSEVFGRMYEGIAVKIA
ncbi:MAG: class I SAM-dependent methyltransferase [Ilumatobacteraceae bacterium]|jgi:ubiquinone/menaquinone biosynthesis C-methylase UbiE